MRILVTGAGRGGTYLLKAAIESFGNLNFNPGEDKLFFEKDLQENYGAKLTTEHEDLTVTNMVDLVDKYPDLRIIFSSRHPADIFMSRLWRGQNLSVDGVDRAIEAITYFHQVYKDINNIIPHKIFCVKMADLILDTNETVDEIAKFLGWAKDENSYNFVEFTNHQRHIERYGKKLDVDQIDNYKRWETAYGGFFKNELYMKSMVLHRLGLIIKDLGYEGYEL